MNLKIFLISLISAMNACREGICIAVMFNLCFLILFILSVTRKYSSTKRKVKSLKNAACFYENSVVFNTYSFQMEWACLHMLVPSQLLST